MNISVYHICYHQTGTSVEIVQATGPVHYADGQIKGMKKSKGRGRVSPLHASRCTEQRPRAFYFLIILQTSGVGCNSFRGLLVMQQPSDVVCCTLEVLAMLNALH